MTETDYAPEAYVIIVVRDNRKGKNVFDGEYAPLQQGWLAQESIPTLPPETAIVWSPGSHRNAHSTHVVRGS